MLNENQSEHQKKVIGMKTLAINKLRPNDYNPNRMTDSEFAEFVAEIKHLGRLPKPIVVRPGNDDEFIIIDGEHALKAAEAVGLAEADCEVIIVDDFEAMRQTYKRNQHGTHNKILLGQMFQRMAKERGLSLRNLAKEVEVSDGTIRNTFEYTKAVKVRNSYAGKGDGEDTEGKIAGLSLRQVKYYNRLPEEIANLWLDSGLDGCLDILTLWRAFYNPKIKNEKEADRLKEYNWPTPEEYLFSKSKELADTGLLQYAKRVWNSDSFVAAIKQVEDWTKWENGYFFHFGDIEWYSREEFRKYARYYYEKIWPFSGDCCRMEYALNILIEPGTESSPARFRLTPEEFDAVVKQMAQYSKEAGNVINVDTFREYFSLAIYEKTGKKVDTKCDVRTQFMKAEIERGAPDYIRESALAFVADKYVLWKTVEELQKENPEDTATIEQIAHELAKQKFVPRDKDCVMGKSDRKFRISIGDDVKLLQEQWAVRNFINKYLFMAKEEAHRKSADNIELAMEITDLFYKREEQKDAHKKMSVILNQLQNSELMALHKGILYCQSVRRMREMF